MIVSLASRNARLMSLRWLDMSMTMRAVDAPQERQHLLDVARRHHLGHLDARRGEQDVDPRRVAPEHVAEVGLGDPVGRQVQDRRRVDRHLEQRPQVAELEAAVDQDGPLVELAERDREVEGDRRLADAALRREHGQDPRRAQRRLARLEVLVHRPRSGSSGRSRRTASRGRRGCRARVGLDRVLRARSGR